jgi:hypothetical protein
MSPAVYLRFGLFHYAAATVDYPCLVFFIRCFPGLWCIYGPVFSDDVSLIKYGVALCCRCGVTCVVFIEYCASDLTVYSPLLFSRGSFGVANL